MSLLSYLPQEKCPACKGVGTVQIPNAVYLGESFAEICPRCRGVGSVMKHLVDAPRTCCEESDDE